MLNQTGGVEGRLLGDQKVLEFGAKGLGLFVVDEVVTLDAPGGDGVDDAISHLLEAGLALLSAEGPRKYFWARMLVALNDQLEGTSTLSCSKATDPSRKFESERQRRSRSLVVRVPVVGREVAADANSQS